MLLSAEMPMSLKNGGLWAGLSNEHLQICLEDFAFLSRSSEEKYRSLNALTRDQLMAECAARKRLDIAERALRFGTRD